MCVLCNVNQSIIKPVDSKYTKNLPNNYKQIIALLEKSNNNSTECIIFAQWLHTIITFKLDYDFLPYPKLSYYHDKIMPNKKTREKEKNEYIKWFNDMFEEICKNKYIEFDKKPSFYVDIYDKLYIYKFYGVYHYYLKLFPTGPLISILGNKSIDVSEGNFILFVQSINGTTATIRFNLSDTVEIIKRKIHCVGNIPTDQQRLIYAGRQLDNDLQNMGYYNIKEQSTLHLILKLRGD
jgi:hypothetical protein